LGNAALDVRLERIAARHNVPLLKPSIDKNLTLIKKNNSSDFFVR
jgi:hypothetical protein